MKSPATVLVVDDDPDFQVQTQAQLVAAGFTVVLAGGRREAEEAAARQPPDLAIVDLMLDQADTGFALCYAFRKRWPAMPIIQVSAVMSETGLNFDAATDEERSWVKADVFLAKPLRAEQLLREIRRLLKEKP
jgi:DNA-binding response OmpR family regulator